MDMSSDGMVYQTNVEGLDQQVHSYAQENDGLRRELGEVTRERNDLTDQNSNLGREI